MSACFLDMCIAMPFAQLLLKAQISQEKSSSSFSVDAFSVGLGELDGTVVGGGDVVTVAGVGEAVVGAGVTEQVVDKLRLAVPVDGCSKGERLADGGLTVGEG